MPPPSLIHYPTPVDASAMLSRATSSDDFNLLEIPQGFPLGDDVVTNTTRAPSTTTMSISDYTAAGYNLTSTDSMSSTQTVLVSLALGIIIVFTVTGNFLVVASILVNTHLRTTTNYFIANLAIADLLLGTTVLPFSASLEVLQYWAFGQIFCDVWAAFDVLCCTASILSLCVISIDRYIGVTRPLQHPAIVGHKRALYVIFGVWILSGIISVAPLIGWKEEPDPNPLVCTVTQHTGYVLFSTALSFYIPCLILLLVYYRIYRKTVAYTKCIATGGKMAKVDEDNRIVLRIHTGNHCSSSTTLISTTTTGTDNNKKTNKKERKSFSNSSKSDNKKDNGVSHNSLSKGHSNGNDNGTRAVTAHVRGGNDREFIPPGNTFQENRRDERGRKKSSGVSGSRISFSSKVAKFKREKKAAKTLGIVVGVFITCWLPFFFILPLQSICASCDIPELMFKLFFWLGYCNSTMNPIIYTCSSTEFRRAFQSILFCRKCRRRRHDTSITTKVKLKVTSGNKGGKTSRGRNSPSRKICRKNSYEFRDVSSGSSKFVSRSTSPSNCHGQNNEIGGGYRNGKNPPFYKSSDLSHKPSDLMCSDCKNMCKNGTHFHSSSLCIDSSSLPPSPNRCLGGSNNRSTSFCQSNSIQINTNPASCICCKHVLEHSTNSHQSSVLIQGNNDNNIGRVDRLPSSCDISMASLSCHSSSPTISSSGH